MPQAYTRKVYNPHNNNQYRYPPNWYRNPPTQQQPRLQQQLLLPIPSPGNTPQVTTSAASEPSLEYLIQKMDVQNLQFKQQTYSTIQNLQTQIRQLITSVNVMEAQGSKQLPPQTVVNPKGPNVSAISLRSNKNVEPFEPAPEKSNKIVELIHDYEVVVDTDTEKAKNYVPLILFLQRAMKSKKDG